VKPDIFAFSDARGQGDVAFWITHRKLTSYQKCI